MATPIRAVAAASSHSARRTSGLRRKSSEGKTTGTSGGPDGIGATCSSSVEERLRLAPEQHSEQMDPLSRGIFQRRHPSLRGRQLGLCLCNLQSVAKIRLESRTGHFQGLALYLDIFKRNGDSTLIATHFDVVPGHFAQQGDKDVATIFHRSGDVRICGFDRTPYAAEEIDLPIGIKTDLEKVLCGRRAAARPLGT